MWLCSCRPARYDCGHSCLAGYRQNRMQTTIFESSFPMMLGIFCNRIDKHRLYWQWQKHLDTLCHTQSHPGRQSGNYYGINSIFCQLYQTTTIISTLCNYERGAMQRCSNAGKAVISVIMPPLFIVVRQEKPLVSGETEKNRMFSSKPI